MIILEILLHAWIIPNLITIMLVIMVTKKISLIISSINKVTKKAFCKTVPYNLTLTTISI